MGTPAFPHHNYYEIVEERNGYCAPAVPLLFERRIDAVKTARDLKKRGYKVRVRTVEGPRYMRR